MAAISATRPSTPSTGGARTRDILLVQINPVERRETPRTEAEIRDRLNEITFNANLMRELRAIDFVDGLIEEGTLGRNGYERVLIHRIDGTDALEDYNAASKLDARWKVFLRLRDKGRAAARRGSASISIRSARPAPSTCARPISSAGINPDPAAFTCHAR